MLSDNIKKIMKSKRVTSKDLAKSVGVSTTHISYVLNSKRVPSIELLEKIADVLNVSVSEFYNEENTTIDKNNTDEELTQKEKFDIEKEAQKMIENIDKLETVEFCGTPADEEDKDYLKLAYERFLTDVRIYNKQKYTPKKYKK